MLDSKFNIGNLISPLPGLFPDAWYGIILEKSFLSNSKISLPKSFKKYLSENPPGGFQGNNWYYLAFGPNFITGMKYRQYLFAEGDLIDAKSR